MRVSLLSLKNIGYWFPVFAALLITFTIAMWYQYPIGVDVHFHLRIAEAWARGENGMFSEIVMRINKMPYPPLQHWLLVPVVLSGDTYFFTAVFQMCLLPIAVATMTYALWKIDDNKYSAVFAGLLVMGSFAYLDRTLVVSPQALNIIFLPLAMLFFVKRKLKLATVFATAMIYTHGVVGICLLGGIWIKALKKRKWLYIILPIILSLPVILPTLPYMVTGWNRMSGGAENDQERGFWSNPLFFTLSYLRFPFAGFFGAVYLVYEWRKGRRHENNEVVELQKIAILTLLATSIMIYPWADRFVQFSSIPLSMILATQFSASKKRNTWFRVVYFLFLFMYAALWLWLAAGSYTVLPEDYI